MQVSHACFPNWIGLRYDFCKLNYYSIVQPQIQPSSNELLLCIRQQSCAESDVASLSIQQIVLEAAVLLGQRNVGETFLLLCMCTRFGAVDQ